MRVKSRRSGGSCPANSRPAIREIGSIRSSPNREVILATKPGLDFRREWSEYAPGTPPGAYFSVEATGRAVAVAYGPGWYDGAGRHGSPATTRTTGARYEYAARLRDRGP